MLNETATSHEVLVDVTRPVTLYFRGDFLGNMLKVEARHAKVVLRPCAQYPRAVHFEWLARGKRRARRTLETSRPTLLVLDGWGHPDPDGAFEVVEERADVRVEQSRYRTYDDRWQTDFNARIGAYLAQGNGRVLADLRGHHSERPR
jgi:hypothetical protein